MHHGRVFDPSQSFPRDEIAEVQSHRLNHRAIVNASDANDHSITPPLSPARHHHPAVNHDPRKESFIIIDEDSSSCVIGTSLDLMLESSSAAPMLGSARSLSPTSRHAQSSARALTFDRSRHRPSRWCLRNELSHL
jgi:hypothetical protein